MTTYKLTYFNITGLAEPIRFLFKYGGLEFEDERVELGDERWTKELKPIMPFGQMPVLEVDGVQVHQHLAICRYLGKVVGLAGDDDWENLQIDIVADTIQDFRQKLAVIFKEQDEEKKEQLFEAAAADTIPFYFEKLDAIINENNGYFANGKLSWVDVYFVALLPVFNMFCRADATERYSGIKQLYENVTGIEAIKTWLEERPVTKF